MTRQYSLPLPHREAMGADDFMVTASNREAVAWIDKWPGWPSHCLIIYGPPGAGKTHLAHVWQGKSRGKLMEAKELTANDVGALSNNRALAIDNADTQAGDRTKEQNLLHLFNLIKESGGQLLLTASRPPAQWNIELPDLRSRLLAAPAAALAAPDDELLSALIVKQFGDRQLSIGMDVVDFLLPRITRTPDAVRKTVAAIDEASLAEGRRVTVALARRVLDQINAS